MTASTTPWRELARRLGDELAADGALASPAWRDALVAIPRHVFVPRFPVQGPDGRWTRTTDEDDGWLAAVYRNQPLVTDLATTADGRRVTVSSSTKPGLMVRMLEALDPHPTAAGSCGAFFRATLPAALYNTAVIAPATGDGVPAPLPVVRSRWCRRTGRACRRGRVPRRTPGPAPSAAC